MCIAAVSAKLSLSLLFPPLCFSLSSGQDNDNSATTPKVQCAKLQKFSLESSDTTKASIIVIVTWPQCDYEQLSHYTDFVLTTVQYEIIFYMYFMLNSSHYSDAVIWRDYQQVVDNQK